MIVCPWKELPRYAAIHLGLEEAVNLAANLQSLEPAAYPLPGGKVMVRQGTTKSAEGVKLKV